MKDEYIIINKTELEKKLIQLEKKLSEEKDSFLPLQRIIGEDSGKIRMIQDIISQSTPLIPVVENAYLRGDSNGQLAEEELKSELKDYIENLKLEI